MPHTPAQLTCDCRGRTVAPLTPEAVPASPCRGDRLASPRANRLYGGAAVRGLRSCLWCATIRGGAYRAPSSRATTRQVVCRVRLGDTRSLGLCSLLCSFRVAL